MTESCFANTDKGYIYLGSKIVDRVKPLGSGIILEASHREGVVHSGNPESPFYETAVFAQGTSVSDTEGRPLGYV